MKRVTLSLNDELAKQFERWSQQHGYGNRSEAFRDLLRDRLERESLDHPAADSTHCIATVSYIYNHHELQLASHLASLLHDHHNLTLSTLHVHLDHDNCLETTVLQGQLGEVRRFAEALIAERGVRHGKLQLIPVQRKIAGHRQHEPHTHLRPVN
jgi:CopG family nickel-responsive transcriptional regulator